MKRPEVRSKSSTQKGCPRVKASAWRPGGVTAGAAFGQVGMIFALSVLAAVLCIGTLAFSHPSDTAGADQALLDRLTTELMCTCGCPHQIRQCGDECGIAPKLIDDLEKLVAQGMTEQQIYARYEAQYGPVIYAAPRKEGFDLMAWVLPFVVLGLGALLVLLVVKKLTPAQAGVASQPLHHKDEMDERYRKLLEKELAE